MNKEVGRLTKEIERRGGQVQLGPNFPDDIAELFLREILACPGCLHDSHLETNVDEVRGAGGRARAARRG